MRHVFFSILVFSGLAAAQMASPQSIGVPAQDLPAKLKDVGIAQKLNAQAPLNLSFRNEFGEAVHLSDYFNQGKPVILSLVYYQCPMMCNVSLNELSSTLRLLKLKLGADYEVVTVSFDPRETPAMAMAKKQGCLQRYGDATAGGAWHFLVGDEENIHQLTDSVGFYYQWDPDIQQFAHATGIMLLTPGGRLSRYFYGVDYSARDLRLGLVQASEGKVGTLVDQLLLYCYHYDPRSGKYGAVITNVMKAGGLATILILGSLLLVMFKSEGKK